MRTEFFSKQTTRRELLRTGGALAGAGVLAGLMPANLLVAAESAAGKFATSDVLRGSHRADEGADVRNPAGDNKAPRQYLSAFRPRWKHGGPERRGWKGSGGLELLHRRAQRLSRPWTGSAELR